MSCHGWKGLLTISTDHTLCPVARLLSVSDCHTCAAALNIHVDEVNYLSRRGMGGDAYLSLGGLHQGSEELFMHNDPAISEELVEDQSPRLMLEHAHLQGRQK